MSTPVHDLPARSSWRVALIGGLLAGALALLLVGSGITAALGGAGQAVQDMRRLPLQVLEDKIRGGWAGQMIGVSFGAPTEFKSNGRIIEGDLPEWSPGRVANAIDQDDLYVEMTFAEVMDRVGLDATSEQYGEAFRQSRYNLWHANAGARRLLAQGVKAPLSGHPSHNVHANDIDFQIESDFIGLMTPGLPRAARTFCERVGRVMNHGDGLYGGMFVTGMYAAAFFDTDPRRVVEAGLASLPPGSGYARIIGDVLEWHREEPGDWHRTWQRIQDRWDREDACPDGSLRPFNIDARLNGAYIALGLLYGDGDFARTLEITTRAGQDSDCNPSNAAGILGVMLGYRQIPEVWRAGISALGNRKFAYTNYSFEDIVSSSLHRARLVIGREGGTVGDREVTIPWQRPSPPPLEQWDMGVPDRRIDAAAADWRWQGAWRDARGRDGRPTGRVTDAARAVAELSFTGSAISVIGRYGQGGGRAEVLLDGRPAGAIDAWIPERTHDNALWHAYDLTPGPHALRIVTTGTADARSSGTVVEIAGAIVYRPR